ncbi:MAG: hypothetical protein ACI915_002865 [Gammaproteobacteria bacterium]|jgi:hypothetical protein
MQSYSVRKRRTPCHGDLKEGNFEMLKHGLLGCFKGLQRPLKARLNARTIAAQQVRPQPFAGVTIKPNLNNCCQEVRHFAGLRYLSHEPPSVRLPNCSAPVCNCVYAHFSDRRKDLRRDADYARV